MDGRAGSARLLVSQRWAHGFGPARPATRAPGRHWRRACRWRHAKRPRGRGRYPRPPVLAGAWLARARSPGLRILASFGSPARLKQQIERTLDVGDHAGGNACVARRCIELVVTEQRLDDADINHALQQVGGKAVAERMQRHGLGDPGGRSRLMEEAIELAGRDRSIRSAPREQQTLLRRRPRVPACRAKLPPLPQQTQQLFRQHDVAVLATLGLHNADDVLGAVDVADPEPGHLARA